MLYRKLLCADPARPCFSAWRVLAGPAAAEQYLADGKFKPVTNPDYGAVVYAVEPRPFTRKPARAVLSVQTDRGQFLLKLPSAEVTRRSGGGLKVSWKDASDRVWTCKEFDWLGPTFPGRIRPEHRGDCIVVQDNGDDEFLKAVSGVLNGRRHSCSQVCKDTAQECSKND